jgi:hypothetical protein
LRRRALPPIAAALIAGLANGCSHEPPKIETDDISYSLDDGWKAGYHREGRGGYQLTQFIRKDAHIDTWREMVTIEIFAKVPVRDAPAHALELIEAQRDQECPGATQWQVVEQSDQSITYEARSKPCAGRPEQDEIARLLDGKFNRFRVSYTQLVPDLPPDQREKWLKWAADCKVVAPPRERDAPSPEKKSGSGRRRNERPSSVAEP